jgi:hypothetical protein
MAVKRGIDYGDDRALFLWCFLRCARLGAKRPFQNLSMNNNQKEQHNNPDDDVRLDIKQGDIVWVDFGDDDIGDE